MNKNRHSALGAPRLMSKALKKRFNLCGAWRIMNVNRYGAVVFQKGTAFMSYMLTDIGGEL